MTILSGRAWITGASSGIGAATAKILVQNGAKVDYQCHDADLNLRNPAGQTNETAKIR